jgi:hypothetical protein
MMNLVLCKTDSTLTITMDTLKSPINICNQIASLKAFVIAMYSTSIVDKAIVDCNVDL